VPPKKVDPETQRKKLKELRARIDEGIAALERGEYDEFDETELESYLRGLATAKRGRRVRK
jgi:hypothetical protein